MFLVKMLMDTPGLGLSLHVFLSSRSLEVIRHIDSWFANKCGQL
jgi:hypothetical protein